MEFHPNQKLIVDQQLFVGHSVGCLAALMNITCNRIEMFLKNRVPTKWIKMVKTGTKPIWFSLKTDLQLERIG